MIETKKLLNIGEPLVYIKQSKEKIELISSSYIYYKLDEINLSIQKKTTIEKNGAGHHFSKVFDISNDNLQVYPKNSSNQAIFTKDNQGLKIVAKLQLDKSISITKFSNNAKMLLMGCCDGHMWLYDVEIGKIIYSFPPRADEISSIAFLKDDSLVAVGSYEKNILIYDTETWCVVASLESKSVPEDILFSNDGQCLYFVQRGGDITAYNLEAKKTIYNKNFSGQWFTLIKTYIADDFAVLGTRSNLLMIIDLKTGKILKKIALQGEGMNCVDFSDKYFFSVFADGSFLVCDAKKYREDVLIAIELEDYQKAKELIDKNIFLYLDGTVDLLYSNWDKVLKKIILMIELNEIKEAVDLASPFLENEEINEQFSLYMSQKEEIALFIRSVNLKDYAKAYKMLEKCEHIRELKKYHDLEELWHQRFNRAKLTIEKKPGDRDTEKKAKEYIESFLNVISKRETIKNLFRNSQIFFKADSLIREKKFAQFFALCENNQFLEETKVFHNAMSVSRVLLQNISKAVARKDYDNALMTANKILDFSPIKEEVSRRINEITIIKNFEISLKSKDLLKTFGLIESNRFLENFSEFPPLLEEFNSVNKKAKILALKGEVESARGVLNEYMEIDYLVARIAFTMKLGYIGSISLALGEGKIDWQGTFMNYIQIYGKDEDLKNIASEHSVLDIFNLLEDDGEERCFKKIRDKVQIVVH